LVGPQDKAFESSRLHSLQNVFFLGPQSPEDLPKYVNSFDVCINPQLLNELTVGNYPRKIDEYLAMGKPIVATKTETMASFKDYVFLAENKQEFVRMIKESLREKDTSLVETRKAFAFSHSWENSLNIMSKYIAKHYVQSERNEVNL